MEIEHLTFSYKNHRGEIGIRRVIPSMFYFGHTHWHQDSQWLLRGFDLDKNQMREFAFKEIMTEQTKRELDGLRAELDEAQQVAGKALGYPWYKDDLATFPGATESDGVCIGEHAGATIVCELATAYGKLRPNPRPRAYICDGCATMTLDPNAQMEAYRAGGHIACCPERKMLPLYL